MKIVSVGPHEKMSCIFISIFPLHIRTVVISLEKREMVADAKLLVVPTINLTDSAIK
jgi:hypothetical protein